MFLKQIVYSCLSQDDWSSHPNEFCRLNECYSRSVDLTSLLSWRLSSLADGSNELGQSVIIGKIHSYRIRLMFIVIEIT